MTKVVKSTSKGQITLPKTWRSQFKTDYFLMEPNMECIVIRPLNIDLKKEKEEVIFDADRDNKGKGVSVDQMIQMLKKIKNE